MDNKNLCISCRHTWYTQKVHMVLCQRHNRLIPLRVGSRCLRDRSSRIGGERGQVGRLDVVPWERRGCASFEGRHVEREELRFRVCVCSEYQYTDTEKRRETHKTHSYHGSKIATKLVQSNLPGWVGCTLMILQLYRRCRRMSGWRCIEHVDCVGGLGEKVLVRIRHGMEG